MRRSMGSRFTSPPPSHVVCRFNIWLIVRTESSQLDDVRDSASLMVSRVTRACDPACQGMVRASQINSRGRHRVASYLADEEGMLRVSREAAVEQPVAQYRPGETIVKQLVAATVRAALDFRWL
jgi:hypothetical protein